MDFLHYDTRINCLTGAIISETHTRHKYILLNKIQSSTSFLLLYNHLCHQSNKGSCQKNLLNNVHKEVFSIKENGQEGNKQQDKQIYVRDRISWVSLKMMR